MWPSFRVAVDKLSFLFAKPYPSTSTLDAISLIQPEKCLSSFPFSLLSHSFFPLLIWSFPSLYKYASISPIFVNVSLFDPMFHSGYCPFLFLFPDNKIPWNRCYAHYLQLFSLFLSWACQAFISIALQKSFFLRSQISMFLTQTPWPTISTWSHYSLTSPWSTLFDFLDKTRHSSELPPCFLNVHAQSFLLDF